MVMGELSQDTELLVIGAGPGGYAAAFRAADLGMDVTMVDMENRPGESVSSAAAFLPKHSSFLRISCTMHVASKTWV